ncbi:hypothetical protein BCR36DRAFT_52212 [Piromyces finnis]|uniref:OCRE domain-containing protein n=1 Tax=Piromyces finnis TaxID=1754191 RepID=A0A1Y1VML3_9FUNG|nr:hypothetical protein BCR36DRAFT_52212 [Piromyces finnis]|eukprot:ORX60166.1 hypothetical protein BCR36DRAFT_52212 [Piromyces finnis]
MKREDAKINNKSINDILQIQRNRNEYKSNCNDDITKKEISKSDNNNEINNILKSREVNEITNEKNKTKIKLKNDYMSNNEYSCINFEKEVNLVFDPVLNNYFDPNDGKYYEIIN